MSSSFQRKVGPKGPSLPGVLPSPFTGQPVTSSGVSDLDELVGGGLQVGTLSLLVEDRGGGYAKLLLKYFLSQGLVHHQSLLVFSHLNLVDSLPSWEDQSSSKTAEKKEAEEEQMVIAWRYQKQQSTKDNNSSPNIGHTTFNMLKNVSKDILEKENIINIPLDSYTESLEEDNSWQESSYCSILKEIREKLQEAGCLAKPNSPGPFKPNKLIRIGLHSFGSLLFESKDSSINHLCTFLLGLRYLLRNSSAVAYLTVPHYFEEEDSLLSKLSLCCDYLMQLESFDGAGEVSSAYKDYHGLFHLIKVSSVGLLGPSQRLQARDLVFKSKRNKFCVETFSLPPDLSETVSRDTSAQNKLKNIDF